MNKTLAWLGISKVENLSHKQIENLLYIYKTPEEILKASKLDLIKYGLTEKQSHQILEINEQQLRTRSKYFKARKSVFHNNRR